MTKFNPDNKETLTWGECLDPAMNITDQKEASQYFKDYVNYIQRNIDNGVIDENIPAFTNSSESLQREFIHWAFN